MARFVPSADMGMAWAYPNRGLGSAGRDALDRTLP